MMIEPCFCKDDANPIEPDCPACVDKVIAFARGYHKEREHYRKALNRIAFEPFGASDATHQEVLDAITDFARATLKTDLISQMEKR